MNRYVPRIEGLEERQYLDASLHPFSAAVPIHADAPASSPLEAEPLLDVGAPESADGWQILERYARKAIRNEEVRYGLLPDHEDMVHEVFVRFWENLGASSGDIDKLAQTDSTEREVLRKSVRQVIDHARYERNRQRDVVDVDSQPVSVPPVESEWLDFRIDVDLGIAGLSSRAKQMLLLRGQGKTVDEIGSELGMAKQRVSEVFSATITNLRRIYELPEVEPAAR